jgi:hypothetical protein
MGTMQERESTWVCRKPCGPCQLGSPVRHVMALCQRVRVGAGTRAEETGPRLSLPGVFGCESFEDSAPTDQLLWEGGWNCFQPLCTSRQPSAWKA